MKVHSVNVGQPRRIRWKGRVVTTGIFKHPVEGRVAVRTLNLDGDGQADSSVHGGIKKAVYVYPFEHYLFWRAELPDMELSPGAFGENLTTDGLREDTVGIGDRFQIGSAELMVTEPRMPCSKLGLRFGREDMPKLFLKSRRSGFYLAVVQQGEVGFGDTIQSTHREPSRVTVTDIVNMYLGDGGNLDLLHRAVRLEALSDKWRERLQRRIDDLSQD
jgi:MOSC domain-containing protein YiiM